jgi:hypothetical protein
LRSLLHFPVTPFLLDSNIFLSTLKSSVEFQGSVKCFVTRYVFTVRGCYHLTQPPSCRTTPCRLSATTYSTYSHLPSISGGRFSIHNLRTRHAVVTGNHLPWYIVITVL